MKRPFTISERRMRGPRRSRVRLGPWPVITFVVIALLTAIAGYVIERQFEARWLHPTVTPAPPR